MVCLLFRRLACEARPAARVRRLRLPLSSYTPRENFQSVVGSALARELSIRIKAPRGRTWIAREEHMSKMVSNVVASNPSRHHDSCTEAPQRNLQACSRDFCRPARSGRFSFHCDGKTKGNVALSTTHPPAGAQPFTMYSVFISASSASICSRELLTRMSRSMGVARLGLKSVK